MKEIIWKTVLITVLLFSLLILVPGAVPDAAAEDALPVYTPVTLKATDVTPIPYDEKTPYAPHEDAFLPDEGGYLDDTISVRVETFRAYETNCWCAWIQIADASQLRTELAKPYPSKSTSWADNISRKVKAVLAINGDYFIDRKEGLIVRNGKELRSKYYDGFDALVIDTDGDFHILTGSTEESFRPYAGRIAHAFCFGPGLVIDGKQITEFPSKMMTPQNKTQRIAFCQMDHLSYLVIATEGPEQRNSEGLTMREFSDLIMQFKPQNAYNLDGGSSTWLVLNHQKLNARTKKRTIADIIYFVTAMPEEASDD